MQTESTQEVIERVCWTTQQKSDCFILKKPIFAVAWKEVIVDKAIDVDLYDSLQEEREEQALIEKIIRIFEWEEKREAEAFRKEMEIFLQENDISKIGEK